MQRVREVAFEDRPMVELHNQHIARAADITLSNAEELAYDFLEPDYGLDLGPEDGIGSQDFDLDLGISFGDGDDVNVSVEQGRDAVASQFSLDSNVLGKHTLDKDLDLLSNASRQMSEHPFAPDVDMFGGDFGGDIDLGITFGDDPPKTPVQARSPSRACELPLLL
jgi:cohesin complex subunit SCC1